MIPAEIAEFGHHEFGFDQGTGRLELGITLGPGASGAGSRKGPGPVLRDFYGVTLW